MRTSSRSCRRRPPSSTSATSSRPSRRRSSPWTRMRLGWVIMKKIIIKINIYVCNKRVCLFVYRLSYSNRIERYTHILIAKITYTLRNLNTFKSRMLRKINVFLPVKTTCFLKHTRKLARMLCNFLAKTVLRKPTHKFYLYLFMWTLCKDGKASWRKKTSMFNNSFLFTWKTSSISNPTWSCGRSVFFV